MLDGFAATAVTALTAQNTEGAATGLVVGTAGNVDRLVWRPRGGDAQRGGLRGAGRQGRQAPPARRHPCRGAARADQRAAAAPGRLRRVRGGRGRGRGWGWGRGWGRGWGWGGGDRAHALRRGRRRCRRWRTRCRPIHYYVAMFGGTVRVAPYATYGTDELASNAVRQRCAGDRVPAGQPRRGHRPART